MTTDILESIPEKIAVESLVKTSLVSFNLTKGADDKEIEGALPENHLFAEDEVYTIIGSLLSKQVNGEEGALLTNGYSNLFYTGACVVRVYWLGYGWRVHAWPRVAFRWGSGSRVFSPAN